MTLGERTADRVAGLLGSWRFILCQSAAIAVWIVVNSTVLRFGLAWDLYPFILLNLGLSLQAAYAGPLILMSQRRLEAKDRERAAKDYELSRDFEAQAGALLTELRLAELAVAEGILKIELLVREVELTLRAGDEEG